MMFRRDLDTGEEVLNKDCPEVRIAVSSIITMRPLPLHIIIANISHRKPQYLIPGLF